MALCTIFIFLGNYTRRSQVLVLEILTIEKDPSTELNSILTAKISSLMCASVCAICGVSSIAKVQFYGFICTFFFVTTLFVNIYNKSYINKCVKSWDRTKR